MTCSRFSLLKTLLMATEANFPCSGYVLSRLPMAGFNPIIYGRFWVITEAQNEQEVYHAVVALRNGTGTFEDALTGALGIWMGCSATLTFDEKAAQRLHGFALA